VKVHTRRPVVPAGSREKRGRGPALSDDVEFVAMSDDEAERLDADRRYNDALTALDRALVRTAGPPGSPPAFDTPAPALPVSGRPPWVRIVYRWLAPFFERQQALNSRVAASLDELTGRERDRQASFERFQTALIVFLQQITAFVETKDRVVVAGTAARLDAQAQAIGALPDLRAQVGVLQRATQMLHRELELVDSRESRADSRQSPVGNPQSSAGSRQSPATSHPPLDDYKYVGFEDRFRGSGEDIRAKLRAYLPVFAGASDVLDVGCGRGEFLALLQAEGVRATGVDANHEMVAVAREQGLDVAESDALEHLESRPDGSLGGLMAAQVVEHLEPEYLLRLLATAFHKLRPGAPIVIETINPACWLAFFSSYLRDFTHVRPVHPETLQYLLQASGFGGVTIRYSAPVPEHMKMQPINLPAETLAAADPASRALVDTARVANANAAILNNLLFSYLDYAAIGHRS
jgi:2-polyprenyl-3-methyl-5-hydroxy-6-metoxy-1,4-benzoquinol methylase